MDRAAMNSIVILVTILTSVAFAKEKDPEFADAVLLKQVWVDNGLSCSSNGSGTVDENGNINTSSQGGCSQDRIAHYTVQSGTTLYVLQPKLKHPKTALFTLGYSAMFAKASVLHGVPPGAHVRMRIEKHGDAVIRVADGRESPYQVVGASPSLLPGVTPGTEPIAQPKHYDHGTDESSFGLVAHVKATEQRASQCVSTVDIGNSEVEVYNFVNPASCLGFTNLSAGMNFKARFSLICGGVFDACTTENVDGAQAGILIYMPPAVPGAGDAIIEEYKIVGTREIPNTPPLHQNGSAREEPAKASSAPVSTPQPTAQKTIGVSCDGNPLIRHDGVAVSQVVTGGPADQAGIRAGDEILAIDDHYLFTIEQLNNAIARSKPGSTIRLRYRRYATINETQLIVGSR